MRKVDGFAKSRNRACFVIPAQAGIQYDQIIGDSRLRGNDMPDDFLRIQQA
jgi:hypothetical protein